MVINMYRNKTTTKTQQKLHLILIINTNNLGHGTLNTCNYTIIYIEKRSWLPLLKLQIHSHKTVSNPISTGDIF